MPDPVDDPAERLADLIDKQDARIAAIFRAAVNSLRDEIDLTVLGNLLAAGRVEEALESLQHIAEALGSASNAAFITSGQSTADFLLGAGVGRVAFDQVNHGAVAQMQQNRLDLIREFTAEQKRATSTAIISGIEAGTNPIAQARNFRDSVGLTEKQWGAVANYRRSLERVGTGDASAHADALGRALRDKRHDSQITRAVRLQQPIPADKIDTMVERYTKRYVKYRAEVIGRTEALRAVHQGNEAMYQQAIDDGTIAEHHLERKWVTHLDGRERHTHLLLAGQKRAWGVPWVTVNGPINYPGDPAAPAVETIQCRCALTTRINRR